MPRKLTGTGGLERNLWVAFAGLFSTMVVTVFLPVEPIVGVVPLWAAVAIATMLLSAVVAAIAGLGYGWPDTA
jgi:hypothetical protein